MRNTLFEKKIIWIVVTILVIFSMMLVSCGAPTPTEAPAEPTAVPEQPTEPPEEPAAPEEPTEVPEEPTAEPEEEMEPVTMTFWDPSTDEGINAIFDQMFDSFEAKYPYITVDNSHHGDYVKKLNTAFAAEATPTLVWAWANPLTFYDYVEQGLIMDLEDAYEEYGWRKYFPDAMYESVLGPDGKPYGVPDFINGTVVAYNKDIFDEYGLTEPQTWDEWLTTLDTLQDNGVTPIGLGLSDGNWQAKRFFEIILNAEAGKEWTEALYAGEHAWNSPEVVAALEKLEMMGPYLAEGSLGMNSRQGWDLWYQQDAAMMVSDTWQFSLHDRDATFNWDFFTFPKINPDVGSTYVGAVSDVMYIPMTSDHPEEAILFLDHFLTEELQGYWIAIGLPFVAGDYFGLINDETVGPANVKLMAYIKDNGFTCWFDVCNASEISGELAPNEFAAVLNGLQTPQAAAENIEAVAAGLFGR
jgi:ABC-type glycerol-3-phosphate transport system substrate-binding protein